MANISSKAYIVAVDMGYGHQRAAFPLLDFSTTPEEWGVNEPMIISANNYPNMAVSDRARWVATQKRYETISRMNSIPFLGRIIFKTMDYFQEIRNFYPRRDLSRPTLQSKRTYKAIQKGFGKDLIDILNKNPLPLICTFFIPAILAEGHGYKGKIYCLCTDTDVSRAWVPYNVEESKIIYLAPTIRVRERLLLYGVKQANVIVTGFPLPREVIRDGDKDSQNILVNSLARRIQVLDSKGIYREQYKALISSLNIKSVSSIEKPLTVTFAVGGAGAQWRIGLKLIKSLYKQILNKQIKLFLVAGTSKIIWQKFITAIRDLGLEGSCPNNIEVIYSNDKFSYFKKFNEILIETDILWTKPSELSFYAGLGLPVIMAPTLGSQERANRTWLQFLGVGFDEGDLDFTNEWLFDWLESGCLAQAALNGYIRIPQNSTEYIKEVVFGGQLAGIKNISL